MAPREYTPPRPGRGYRRTELTLTAPADAPGWHADAACANLLPPDAHVIGWDPFFPEKGQKTGAAKRLCAACPVRHECLEEALSEVWIEGVWGGTTPRERRRILRGRAKAVRA